MPVTLKVFNEFLPDEVLAAVSPEVIQNVVADVMSGARAEWIRLAQGRLHSSRRDYIDGIQEVETGPGFAAVTLLGALANMVEQGASAFDMHETLLGAGVPIAMPGQRGKHVNAEGKFYRAIPFRHQTPGTLGQGGGAPMGSAYARMLGVAPATKMGLLVHREAKKLAATLGQPGGPVAYGGRLQAGLAPKLKNLHSTDIYAGMVRQKKTYAKSSQNTYTTFRMISESVPDKWMHPGIVAANLASGVGDYLDKVAPLAFQNLVLP